jgi:hypothetical protein
MYRLRDSIALRLVALAACAVGCGESSPVSPTAPTPLEPALSASLDGGEFVGSRDAAALGAGAALDAAESDVTLKVSAPGIASPERDEETGDIRVTLVALNASAEYETATGIVPFTYRFELYRGGVDSTDLVLPSDTVEQGADTTEYVVPVALSNGTDYAWQVRAEFQVEDRVYFGPWSDKTPFRTPPNSISPPIPTSPPDGATDVWPVRLEVTNGDKSDNVGPVRMTFEYGENSMLGDSAGTRKKEKAAGRDRTVVELSAEDVEPTTTYYWRVIARDDQGTTSDPSDVFRFETAAATIAPPTLTQPPDGAEDVRRPVVLRVANGATRGPVGTVSMTFEYGQDSMLDGAETIEEPAGRDTTSVLLSAGEVEPETTYYWRVTAHDVRGKSSDRSQSPIHSFTTAAAGAGSGIDAIDPSEVTWIDPNIGGWPATSTITDVRIRDVPAGGICIEHTKADEWPGVVLPAGPRPVAGNPWVFGKVNGRWYAATYEWLRPGQICKLNGPGEHDEASIEVGSHTKRPPLRTWVPRSGEQVGFMVSTLARWRPQGKVHERSNIVVVTWP